MWPVPELRVPFPEDLHACEDTDFLVLICQRCDWVAIFTAAAADPEEIRRVAWEHASRCPAR